MSEIKMAEGSMSEIELAEENMSEMEMAKGKMARGKMDVKKMPENETSETKKAKKKMSWKEIAKKKMSWKKIAKKKMSGKKIPKGSKMSWKKIAWRPEFKKDLPSFSGIVHAAESKVYENRDVRWWFDELKEVMYDRDDLQDEIDTERLRRRLENKPHNLKAWLRELISTTLIERRWKEIVARKDYLQMQNEMLGFPFGLYYRWSSTMTYSTRRHPQATERYSIPFVKGRFEDDFQVVYGRDEDQKAIIKLLLSDDVYADHMDVIPIVGVSGVGKTTLAGLVYKDYRVSKHFDLNGWVYVSDDFDVFQFTKTLLEVFTGQTSDIKDISDLQVKLKESLYLKKCLLVLDDVCCEDSSVLAMMCEPLLAGAKGSKILVTTQSASVASKMGTRTAHCLNPLRYEDSWKLFAKHAFRFIGSHPELEATGKQIVTKCDGLPLAIVTLGAMLYSEPKIHEWEAVLTKTPDSCTSDFIPVLLISYDSLPEYLKLCFAYCSIFPKDYEYEKEKLVLLWMAEGLLPHVVDGFDSTEREIELDEEVGHKYFDYLTSRSFFQQSSANKSGFVMHPAMNNLARLVSGDVRTGQKRGYLVPAVKERFEDDFQVVYGRDKDQKAIIKLLLSDDVYADHMDVIPIVGVSGVGKTTLAGLVYKDYRASKHFDLKGWVYVSDDFDVFRFTKTLLEVFTGQTSDIKDLSDLQVKLKESLYMKKCLLVLDDVCCEDSSVLAMMCEPLLAGAKGSKIVVTTRSASVASKMGTRLAHCLNPLRYEDSWMLFTKHAFDDKNKVAYPVFEATGKQIVSKCDGLPLAIVTLGAMLYFELTIHEWKAVLMKTPDSCTSDFIPVLLISYNSLPEYLKPCFAYCSIFPKDYEYEKEELVLLWMAEGLLPHVVDGFDHRTGREIELEIEEVGHKCFDYLTSLSFFQQSNTSKSRFVMHPAMSDLARLVSGDFCSVNNESQMVSPKVRHLSFSGDLNAERCKAICQETKLVRTLLPYKLPVVETACQLSELEDLFMALRHLRVLSLSHYHITELPDSIKKLKLLRYLDLSHTAITRFPDTVSTLYNLQTLLLSCCHSLAELPKNMGNLVNLRYLDIRETCLEEMPAKMGFLTSLRSLSNFFVGKDSGSKIMELGPLSNLQGTLHISQLQNVVSAGDACEAELKNKAGLQMLGLEWSDGTVSSQNQTEVLQQLEPHKNLKKLSIISYGGKSFPIWLGDSSSKMVFLHLSNCNSCSHLPSLGQLPSLKELKVERMNRVKLVGPEFYGWNYSRVNPFPSLERLVFQEMLEWEEWISPKIEGEEFPSLKWIRISGCPKLAKDLHLCLPPLAEVEISDSPLLKVPVRDDLQFGNDDKVAGRPPMHPLMKEKQLAYEDEGSSQSLEHRTDVPATSQSSPPESSELLTESAPSKLPVIAEKQLHEGHKSQFRRNEKLQDRPSTSREVESSQLVDNNEVQGTDVSMTVAATDRSSDTDTDDPINVWYDGESLDGNSSPEKESLNVSEISQLKRLPPKLYDLKIEGCDALKSLPEELMHNSSDLQRLYIIGCHFLKSIHARSLPDALKTLYISKCEKLEFLSPEGRITERSEHTSLEHLCIENSCDSLNSFPLDCFPKLRSLFIQGCANFNSISIKSEDHKYLDALEIRDCAQLKSFPEGGLRIPNLTSILLSNCKNLKALPGQLHSLTSLQSLFINECPELESIPEGGLPSSLNLFCIRSCDKLTPRIDWGLHQLRNFSRIEIEGGCRDLESFPEQNLLPMKLNSLQISRFPNLKILNYKGLQHLTSLETLKITGCGELQSLSEKGLPSSLSYLYISDCPLLKSKLHNKREEWYKIAHIPHIQIDGKVIS